MRIKKVKIIIQPIESLKAEWVSALKGEVRHNQDPNTIIFTSLSAVAQVLTARRLELLGVILKSKPESIYALAKLVNRDFKNVYTDVKILTDLGLIELRPTGKRDSMKPVAKYNGIELDLAA